MTLRQQGICETCGKPLYGDEYGAAGHKCERVDKIDDDEIAFLVSLMRQIVRLNPGPNEDEIVLKWENFLKDYNEGKLEE